MNSVAPSLLMEGFKVSFSEYLLFDNLSYTFSIFGSDRVAIVLTVADESISLHCRLVVHDFMGAKVGLG